MSIYVDIKKKVGNFLLQVKFESGNETLALLGDSGCGKSMTLRCIAGIINPDEGVIRINGTTVFDSTEKICLKPQQRKVGYLFQNYALFPNMTVLENVMTGLEREKHMKKGEKKALAMEYVRQLHLSGLENQYPSQLSGGQQQRTALARILISKPDLLMLDEPFSALDATLRWEMEQVVRSTIKDFEGSTLLVTHNRDEVYRLSEKVAVYHTGKIVEFKEKWELFERPETAVSARLTGCKNLSPAHWEDGRIYAEDWGLDFAAPQGDWKWIGIRAHRFELCDGPGEDIFEYEMTNRIEDTFSFIYQIRKKGGPPEGELRWEVEKIAGLEVPDTGFIHVPHKEILLLRGFET